MRTWYTAAPTLIMPIFHCYLMPRPRIPEEKIHIFGSLTGNSMDEMHNFCTKFVLTTSFIEAFQMKHIRYNTVQIKHDATQWSFDDP